MLFSRNIFNSLLEHLTQKQVTVITGMRRTGKTTLVKQLMASSDIAQKIYFDLDITEKTKLHKPNKKIIDYQQLTKSKQIQNCI
jgi:uncharacterized protein